MNLTVFLGTLLIAGLASAGPPASEDRKFSVTKSIFTDDLAKYTAEHEIVNLMMPLNDLNLEDTDDEDHQFCLFFAQVDKDKNGKRVYKGLFVMKNYVVTKLLDNGRGASADNDKNKNVYFAAQDGIYLYNAKENTAEKYGTITDSIIDIAKVNGSDVIYILTEDHVLYKVTDAGNKKTKVDGVVDALQIVLDYENNLYYYTGDKQVYVISANGVKKIEGLPAATYINLLKPPLIYKNGVPVIVNNKVYIVYVHGTVQTTDYIIIDEPTAFSMEGTVIQYYAYNKKIYEYNYLLKVGGKVVKPKDFLADNTGLDELIVSTRSRGGLMVFEGQTNTEKSD